MTRVDVGGRRKPGGYWPALLVLVVFAAAAYWALTTLFPAELHQSAQWLQAKFGALLK